MKTNFFVTLRASGPGDHKAVSNVVRSTSKKALEAKLKSYAGIDIITIIAVCEIQEMCK